MVHLDSTQGSHRRGTPIAARGRSHTALIDGLHGYTCAQYINSAYRVKGCSNNAEMLDGGTVRVMKGKVIHAGEEILMAYNAGYWSRWAPWARKLLISSALVCNR